MRPSRCSAARTHSGTRCNARLLTSAIRAGELDLATALVNERLATRESSVYTLTRFAEIANARADLPSAQRYAKAAATYRSQFAQAI